MVWMTKHKLLFKTETNCNHVYKARPNRDLHAPSCMLLGTLQLLEYQMVLVLVLEYQMVLVADLIFVNQGQEATLPLPTVHCCCLPWFD